MTWLRDDCFACNLKHWEVIVYVDGVLTGDIDRHKPRTYLYNPTFTQHELNTTTFQIDI